MSEHLRVLSQIRVSGEEVMALSVSRDHFELSMPGHVHLLQAQMEKGFAHSVSH